MMKERPRLGHSRITYYRRGFAGSRLVPEDIPTDPIQRAQILHITGITPALGSSTEKAIDHALDLAELYNTRVSFDVNHRSNL